MQVSKMDDEKLIECVRSHPALYNLANSQYLDTKYKNYLWRKIAVELSLTENGKCYFNNSFIAFITLQLFTRIFIISWQPTSCDRTLFNRKIVTTKY